MFLDKFINSKRIHEIGCYDDIKGKESFYRTTFLISKEILMDIIRIPKTLA